MLAALAKAEALAAFARSEGALPDTFQVALTLGEGYELLDWLLAECPLKAKGRGRAQLEEDIAKAKVKGDPFEVLARFQLHGLPIVRSDLLS